MKTTLFTLGMAGLLAVALAGAGLLWADAPQGAPVITKSFAARELRPGDTWKVYVTASDPAGRMKNIYCEIMQPGVGEYPISITRIKKGDEKELSGFLHLSTSSAGNLLNYTSLELTVQVQDQKGRFSEPAVFRVSFNPRAPRQEPPPQGAFQEKDLGPVMAQIRSLGDGGGGEGRE